MTRSHKHFKQKALPGVMWGLLIALLFLTSCTRTTQGGPIPAQYGSTPADLRPGYQEIYLDLVARAYQADPTLDLEMVLGPGWTREKLHTVLQAMLDKTPRSEVARTARLQNLVKALETKPIPSSSQTDGGTDTGTTRNERSPEIGVLASVSVLFILLLVALIALPAFARLRPRPIATKPGYYQRVEPIVWAGEPEKPLLQFITTFTSGDVRYDPSLTIETETGEFLGECGIGASETMGKDKTKVVAFEVWLFDKHDIRTLTQMLVSEHVFHDDTLRAKLASKGDLVLARPGQMLRLQTAKLRVLSRVLEMSYGTNELPPNSIFTGLKMEWAVWRSG